MIDSYDVNTELKKMNAYGPISEYGPYDERYSEVFLTDLLSVRKTLISKGHKPNLLRVDPRLVKKIFPRSLLSMAYITDFYEEKLEVKIELLKNANHEDGLNLTELVDTDMESIEKRLAAQGILRN